ncbi:hypothetical protein VTK73DRAFT_1435 [Phialemonium thermophilum]|uniref:NIMA interactive protein n=1 Tax=Phialemonium thermophilum TaxID=223376 RepID=A0ABR3X9I0_9PEZI
MIDSENLRTASLYINNQLLSRGLLRDGQTIDFAHPGETDAEIATTMGRIISVVNDLILRRDRDAEHRESLSTTLRALRAESLRQTNDIQQLRDKHAEAQRKASLAEASEAALRAQLRSAESGVQKLKEEAARTKALVAQTRAACANEVRKRDRQIDALRRAVSEAGRARGATRNAAVATITVIGEVSGPEDTGPGAVNTDGEEYDLRMETNTFLAELAKGLSEENETLVCLLRRTNASLKEMSGWDKDDETTTTSGNHLAVALPVDPEEMASEIDSVLAHLRTILTNPSFVPIEEVVVREEEIVRLRDGWEKMESRWKEAVHLIDGWRRRMQVDGRPVNVEELKMGLRLSPVRVNDVEETAQGLGLRLPTLEEVREEEQSVIQSPCPSGQSDFLHAPGEEDQHEDSDAESSMFEDDVDEEELDVDEPNVQILQQSTMLDSPPLPLPPQLSPLRDSTSAGNRGVMDQTKRSQPLFSAMMDEGKTWDKVVEQPKPSLVQTKSADAANPPLREVEFLSSESSLDSVVLLEPAEGVTRRSRPASAAAQRRPESKQQLRPESKQQLRSESTPAATRARAKPASRPPSARGRPAPSRSEQPTQVSKPSRPPSSQRVASSSSQPNMSTASSATSTSFTSGTNGDGEHCNKKPSSPDMPPPPLPTEPASGVRSPRRVNSRLPLPRPGVPSATLLPPPTISSQQPPQSPLTMATIAAKLAASEREADAARVRAKLKAARLGKKRFVVTEQESLPAVGSQNATANAENGLQGGETRSENVHRRPVPPANERERITDECEVDVVPLKEDCPPKRDDADLVSGGEYLPAGDPGECPLPGTKRKRERRTSKVASRRRSTLNPWELQSLISGQVSAGPVGVD